MNHARVWVLSKGEYSDYRVVCACPSEQDAEQLAARMNADRSSNRYADAVEVESLLMLAGDAQKISILYVGIDLWADGTESNAGESIWLDWPMYTEDDHPVRAIWGWLHNREDGVRGGRLQISGTDHERVRKVYSERRAEILAEFAGLT